MRWQLWGYTLIPAAAGLVVASLLLNVPTIPNPILSLRCDLGILAGLCGVGLSTLIGAGVLVWERARRRCEQQLSSLRTEAAADRSRFLRRLDHELKNPLTAIRAGLANLDMSQSDPARQQALASVEAQVLRLSQLTSDLRKLAELEARPLERDRVDIAELLREAVSLAEERPGVSSRSVVLALPQAPWPVPEVLGDWDLLFLAIYNLLDNALKFTGEDDRVEVRAVDDRGYVLVEVADTGPGIPDEELPRVWEELYRGQQARGVPGSGLGLALARTIVERHGGEIRLRSRVGQGTAVAVRLPVA
jgi:signal transduction histidine kinase